MAKATNEHREIPMPSHTYCPHCKIAEGQQRENLILELDTIFILDKHNHKTSMNIVRCHKCKTFLSFFTPKSFNEKMVVEAENEEDDEVTILKFYEFLSKQDE